MKKIIAILFVGSIIAAMCPLRGLAFEESVVEEESDIALEYDEVSENTTSEIIYVDDMVAVQLGIDQSKGANPYNDYESLKVAAQLTQQGKFYFIVDTYHNQVLYADDMWKPLSEWRVMSRDLNMPHAVASDGEVYIVADTDNNRLMCYEYVNGGFQNTQRLDDIGIRPHYIQYDSVTQSFFAWSSMTGEMYIIKREPVSGHIYVSEIRRIIELDGFYVRSFYIYGDEIVFPSGTNSYIIVADKETLEVKERYEVASDISGMAGVRKIGSYWYMTVSTDETDSHAAAKLIRTQDLASLSFGLYEDVTGLFTDMEVPYYIEAIGGSYYVTNHGGRRNVYKFDVADDTITNVYMLK